MRSTGVSGLGVLLGCVLAGGCSYKMQHYGYAREIKIGSVAFQSCENCPSCPHDAVGYAHVLGHRQAGNHAHAGNQGHAGNPARAGGQSQAIGQPQAQAGGPQAEAVNHAPLSAGNQAQAVPPSVSQSQVDGRLPAPQLRNSVRSPSIPLGPPWASQALSPRGWVGLPDF